MAMLLADDEEDFIFHVDHDMLIASTIQDADSNPNLLASAEAHMIAPPSESSSKSGYCIQSR